MIRRARFRLLVPVAVIAIWSARSAAQSGTPASASPELGGLEIGETLAEARQAFSAAGRRIVRVANVTFREPYELDNLINERGEIYGNIGVCRGRIANILITISTYDQLMQVLRQRIAQHGQPETSFGMSESSDGSSADEHVAFSWPRLHLQIAFPASVAAAQRVRGAQILSNGSPCA